MDAQGNVTTLAGNGTSTTVQLANTLPKPHKLAVLFSHTCCFVFTHLLFCFFFFFFGRREGDRGIKDSVVGKGAKFDWPRIVAMRPNGSCVVTEAGRGAVRQMAASGAVTTLGTGRTCESHVQVVRDALCFVNSRGHCWWHSAPHQCFLWVALY